MGAERSSSRAEAASRISVRGWPRGLLLHLLVPMGAAGAFVLLQWRGVIASPESETPLVVLVLIHYLGAAVFHLTSLYQRDALLERLGLWTTAVGLGLNAAAWGTRGLIVGYYPLSNLYDTALFFALATAAASLIVTFSSGQHLVGALAMPVAVLLVVLGLLYGNDVQDLPPVLVSYWRPIHVTLAMAGYGACTVSFVTALLYLLKDRVRLEVIAIFALAIPTLTYAFISGGSILGQGDFFVKLLMDGERVPIDPEGREFLRASVPYVGAILRVAFVASVLALIAFAIFLITAHPFMRAVGHWAARLLLVLQGAGILVLLLQLQRARDVAALIDPAQRRMIPEWWVQQFGSRLELRAQGSALEIAALFAAFALTGFIVVFGWKMERLLEAIPSLEALDQLTYRAVMLAFPLLTLMVITGAVWANESWGRYWGWDPKETWALITWLFYATFLHTRITHGWKGRRSALLAVLGFVAVMFTYLGVSFLLPGLHSYAGRFGATPLVA
ncbi:Cytochrome c biogenesis protein CcsA [bacterium HR08]|nr:Cytochrome c biogenesis protein CcsA [bacterium HR08]